MQLGQYLWRLKMKWIHVCLWGYKFLKKSDPRNPWTLIPHEKWWFHSTLWNQQYQNSEHCQFDEYIVNLFSMPHLTLIWRDIWLCDVLLKLTQTKEILKMTKSIHARTLNLSIYVFHRKFTGNILIDKFPIHIYEVKCKITTWHSNQYKLII
jgi:hypothetical protein